MVACTGHYTNQALRTLKRMQSKAVEWKLLRDIRDQLLVQSRPPSSSLKALGNRREMTGLRTRGREDPTLFSRSAPGSQHGLHAVAHRHKTGGVIRLAFRDPDAVLIPVDVFDPHGKDLVRSHAAVLQNNRD
jgi:hypothetical protein